MRANPASRRGSTRGLDQPGQPRKLGLELLAHRVAEVIQREEPLAELLHADCRALLQANTTLLLFSLEASSNTPAPKLCWMRDMYSACSGWSWLS